MKNVSNNICFCCRRTVENVVVTINEQPICDVCYTEHYPNIPALKCVECGTTTSKFHGVIEDFGFVCNICILLEHEHNMVDLINDPAHANIPIEDIFVDMSDKPALRLPRIKKGLADLMSLPELIRYQFNRMRGTHNENKKSYFTSSNIH
jgi:hypothetical protein